SFQRNQIVPGGSVHNKDVLISGAGVAGQALAIWLRRFGFSPVVVERAPAPRDGGQAVDLRGAAIEVARRTGILDAARAARTGTRGMSYVNSAGKRLASLNGAFGVIDARDVETVRGHQERRRVNIRRFHLEPDRGCGRRYGDLRAVGAAHLPSRGGRRRAAFPG